jgi:hypothetical protein
MARPSSASLHHVQFGRHLVESPILLPHVTQNGGPSRRRTSGRGWMSPRPQSTRRIDRDSQAQALRVHRAPVGAAASLARSARLTKPVLPCRLVTDESLFLGLLQHEHVSDLLVLNRLVDERLKTQAFGVALLQRCLRFAQLFGCPGASCMWLVGQAA